VFSFLVYIFPSFVTIFFSKVTILLPDFNSHDVQNYFDSIYNGRISMDCHNDLHSIFNVSDLFLNSNNIQLLGSSSHDDQPIEKKSNEFVGYVHRKASKGRKKSSLVWEHFLQDSDNSSNCVCQYCFKVIISQKSSTSAMLKHLIHFHKEKLDSKSLSSKYKIVPLGNEFTNLVPISTETKKLSLDYNISEDGLVCQDCGKIFSTRCSARQHWRNVHSGVKLYHCQLCGKEFSRKEVYEAHLLSHSGEKSFMCSECGKTFNRKHVRDIHERIHKKDLRYSCKDCDKVFINNYQLTNHMRVHSGEKPFICNICEKRFTQKHHLVTHMRVHTGTKPYQCSSCKNWFKYLSTKRNHKCSHVQVQ